MGISVSDGKLLWQLTSVPPRRAYNAATPIVDGQTVIYAGKGRGTKAVKIEKQGSGFTANELWSNPELGVQFNTPVLSDGLLFGLSDQSNLFCIDAKTGQTAWTDSTSRGRGGFAAIVDAGPCLLALPSNSELLVFKTSGKEYAELARIKVADTATYAQPVVAGKRIYVKAQETLAMLTIE
ncbi:MAG: outer membrane protein assembly factor BamB family protein [Planctomycetota bacterium]